MRLINVVGGISIATLVLTILTGCGSDNTAMIAAAKERACNHVVAAQDSLALMTGSANPPHSEEMSTCKASMDNDKFTYSVNSKGDSSAEVVVFKNGKQEGTVTVAKDNNGDWHPTETQ